ncbi:MAG: metalloregulator ArsR/SmtB family transcription factor [Bacillota bacterium]|nr:metalloregulator ArsR/SmtB family transcription factor [Bacillota bacterium]
MNKVDQPLEQMIGHAELLKVLAHPMRLCIVQGLLQKGTCNVSYMQDCLNLPQSTISQHLAKLRAAQIIAGTRDGVEVHYRVVNETAVRIVAALFP